MPFDARDVIQSSPLLYRLWFHAYRQRVGASISWFRADTALFLDAYPRSGSTFAVHLMRQLWPALHAVHHFHAIAPLKLALRRGLPTFILVREPGDAIASNYLKRGANRGARFDDLEGAQVDRSLLERLCAAYVTYYRWVERHRRAIALMDFDRLVADPAGLMMQINQSLAPELALPDEAIELRVRELQGRPFGAKDKFGASFPTEEKRAAKAVLRRALAGSDHFATARALRERLLADP